MAGALSGVGSGFGTQAGALQSIFGTSFSGIKEAYAGGSTTLSAAVVSGGQLVSGGVVNATGILQNAFGNFGTGAGQAAQIAFDKAKESQAAGSQTLSAAVVSGGQLVGSNVTSAIGLLQGAFKNFGAGASQAAAAAYAQTQQEQDAKAKALAGAVQAANNFLSGAVVRGGQDVATGYKTFGGTATSAAEAAYSQTQREQDAKARALASAVTSANNNLAQSVIAGGRDVAGGYKTFGSDAARAAAAAYEQTKREQDTKARALEAAIAAANNALRGEIVSGGGVIGGAFSSALGAVLPKLNTFFSSQGSAVKSGADTLGGSFDRARTTISSAMDRIKALISGFKWPALPPPPTIPNVSTSRSASGYPGAIFEPPTHITPFSISGNLSAFAANGLPDPGANYASATSSLRSYAAEASPLLDLFSMTGRSMRLTSVQERSLTLQIGGDSFVRSLGAPIAVLERSANLMWQTAQFERETAAINRETAALLRGGSGTSTLELARRPGKRDR